MDRPRTVAALLLGSALLLGGCGGDPGPTDRPTGETTVGSSVLADALAAAERAGSARITGSIATTGTGGGTAATLSGVQAFDPAAMDLTISSDAFGAGVQVRQVLVDGRAYVQLPELEGRWMPIEPASFAGTLSPLLSGADAIDLPGLAADGTGTVEGAAVSFYTAEVDLDTALGLAGVPAEALAGRFAQQAGSAKIRIAVDDAGRLVEWQVASTVALTDGGTMTSTADLRFYDFGVATDITAPAPDRIVESGPAGG